MPVHPPYADPTIMPMRPRASNRGKTRDPTNRAADAKLEFIEMTKFFGSLMLIYSLTGLAIMLIS